VWNVSRLWELADNLRVQEMEVSTFDIKKNFWFVEDEEPTVDKIIEHTERIVNADLDYPIILCDEGRVMDGMHRIAKAIMLNLASIKFVQFSEMPEPCKIETHINNKSCNPTIQTMPQN
jgi:hypothetical protein